MSVTSVMGRLVFTTVAPDYTILDPFLLPHGEGYLRGPRGRNRARQRRWAYGRGRKERKVPKAKMDLLGPRKKFQVQPGMEEEVLRKRLRKRVTPLLRE